MSDGVKWDIGKMWSRVKRCWKKYVGPIVISLVFFLFFGGFGFSLSYCNTQCDRLLASYCCLSVCLSVCDYDTYQNLQRHRGVLPAIARLLLILCWLLLRRNEVHIELCVVTGFERRWEPEISFSAASMSIDIWLMYDANSVDKSDWRRGRSQASTSGALHLFQFLMTTCC